MAEIDEKLKDIRTEEKTHKRDFTIITKQDNSMTSFLILSPPANTLSHDVTMYAVNF